MLQAKTIADGIANLSISGLRIKTLKTIPSVINPRDCPVMTPDVNYITGFTAPRKAISANAFREASRNLNYWVLFAEVGQGRGIWEYIESMVTLFDTIATNLLNLSISGVDIEDVSLNGFGVIKDTNQKDYFGFGLSITVSEFINE